MSLIRVIRAGSRTVVIGLEPTDLVVDLARHGCRLMLVSESPDQVAALRQELVGQGLRSQVMGSQNQLRALPTDLYEAALILDPAMGRHDLWLNLLEPGGMLVSVGQPPQGIELVSRGVPKGFWAQRK